jgi:hypothetical protein
MRVISPLYLTAANLRAAVVRGRGAVPYLLLRHRHPQSGSGFRVLILFLSLPPLSAFYLIALAVAAVAGVQDVPPQVPLVVPEPLVYPGSSSSFPPPAPTLCHSIIIRIAAALHHPHLYYKRRCMRASRLTFVRAEPGQQLPLLPLKVVMQQQQQQQHRAMNSSISSSPSAIGFWLSSSCCCCCRKGLRVTVQLHLSFVLLLLFGGRCCCSRCNRL